MRMLIIGYSMGIRSERFSPAPPIQFKQVSPPHPATYPLAKQSALPQQLQK
jgi:hypothetical protein